MKRYKIGVKIMQWSQKKVALEMHNNSHDGLSTFCVCVCVYVFDYIGEKGKYRHRCNNN